MKAVYLSTTGDTTTHLPVPLEVEGYGCGVIEMKGTIRNGFRENLYLCCDIIEDSVVKESKMPVLRWLDRTQKGLISRNGIRHVIWLRVMRPNISSIRLYIADEYGEIVSLRGNKLDCTLLFVPPS